MADDTANLRDFIYLDPERVRSLAAQLHVDAEDADDAVAFESLYLAVEPRLLERALSVDASFDYAKWTGDGFRDGQLFRTTGAVRLLDFSWLSSAMGGLPQVLKKMSKLEMEALRNSDEGRRMSKQQLQQRSQENQNAIAQVEAFKADELGETIRELFGDVVRVKVRPSAEHPRAVFMGAAYSSYFTDSPAALAQKYGVDIDAGWQIVGQLNAPRPADDSGGKPLPIPTGNKMEDAFEQMAVLMNNAFQMSAAPAFPAVSFTPIAIWRAVG
jgi:hypothetical protein